MRLGLAKFIRKGFMKKADRSYAETQKMVKISAEGKCEI